MLKNLHKKQRQTLLSHNSKTGPHPLYTKRVSSQPEIITSDYNSANTQRLNSDLLFGNNKYQQFTNTNDPNKISTESIYTKTNSKGNGNVKLINNNNVLLDNLDQSSRIITKTTRSKKKRNLSKD